MSTPESNIVTFKLELEVSSASLAIDAILGATKSKAVADIIAERIRQVEAEGWTPEHDDKHERGQMAIAAACYAANAGGFNWIGKGEIWPWARKYWKPSTPRRDLIKAAALILAEIERIDRAEAAEKGGAA